MAKRNTIKVSTPDLCLELSGEANLLKDAYEAVRPILISHFAATFSASSSDDVTGQTRKPAILSAGTKEHINFVVCNEVYNKVYLVELEDLEQASLSRVLDLSRVSRVFISRSQKDRFEEFFSMGKVLWRELTTAGRAVVKRKE